MSTVDGAVKALRGVVRRVVPASISGEDALALVELFAEAERVVASGMALVTPRVTETGAYAKGGYASGPDWLAAVSGSSAGAARSRLAAAHRAAAEPVLSRPLREGKLSAPELKVLSDTAVAAPEALGDLVAIAVGESSHKELADAAARAKSAARSAESAPSAAGARVHASRHLSWHQDDGGGIRGEFLCDEVAWARVAPLLEAESKKRWRDAGVPNSEDLGAHRLDAFIDLLGARIGWGERRRGRTRTDLGRRGRTAPGPTPGRRHV